jgi:hypothetical protein
MDAELGVNLAEQMHMVGHDFKLDDFRPKFFRSLIQDFLQSGVYAVDEHFAAVLGTPDDVVLAGIDNVAVALVWNVCSHSSIISQRAV